MTERFLSYYWLITHHFAASFLSLRELACADRVFCMGWDYFSSVVIFLSHIMSTGSGGRHRKELASWSPCWCWISLSASKAAAPADHFIRNAWRLSSRAHPPRIHPSGACRWNLTPRLTQTLLLWCPVSSLLLIQHSSTASMILHTIRHIKFIPIIEREIYLKFSLMISVVYFINMRTIHLNCCLP